jgi:hypothetical protein
MALDLRQSIAELRHVEYRQRPSVAEFLRATNFPWFWIAGAGGSGWRWPEAGDAEDLIGGERDDAEHEVAF